MTFIFYTNSPANCYNLFLIICGCFIRTACAGLFVIGSNEYMPLVAAVTQGNITTDTAIVFFIHSPLIRGSFLSGSG